MRGSTQVLQAGTITKLLIQSKPPYRVAVFLDGVLSLEVSQALVSAFGLCVGYRLTDEERERILAAEQLLTAKATALHYMAYRPRTAHEVRQRLRREGYDATVVTQVIAQLHTHGNLDDAAYAHAYLKERRDRRRDGPQRIRSRLRQRGVRQGLIDEAMQQHLSEADVLAAAWAQGTKYWHRLSRLTDPATRQKKLADALRRRGFPSSMVWQVVKRLETDPEDK